MHYFFNLRIYRNWRRHTTFQQIIVKIGNLKLLIINLQDNFGLCRYVICVRETSVVGSNKRELKVMKLFNSCRLRGATLFILLVLYFMRNFFAGFS